MTTATSPTKDEIISSLTFSLNQQPYGWNGGALGQPLIITYSIVTRLPSYYEGPSSEIRADAQEQSVLDNNIFKSKISPLLSGQISAINSIIMEWEKVANIDFQDVGINNDYAAITIGSVGFQGDHYGLTITDIAPGFPQLPPLSSAANSLWGDVWLNNSGPKGTANLTQTQPGQDGYETILHELGHALGLNHPFGHANALASNDNQLYTTMSYTDYKDTSLIPSGWYPSSPMLYDILAIQTLYGVNSTTNIGNDGYAFGTRADAIQVIWDAGGSDIIDAYDKSEPVTIDLRPGHFSFVGKDQSISTQQIAVAFEPDVSGFDNEKCWIEGAIGGNKSDKLIGNDGANQLTGGDGNDYLEGGLGGDIYLLQSTGGIDTIVDHSGTDEIQIDGAAVAGEFRPDFNIGRIYYSADQAYELRPLPGGDWRVSAHDAATGEYRAVADLDGWQQGGFGISQGGAGTEENPATPRATVSAVSTHYLHMNGSAATKGVQFDGGSKSDSFYGSNHSDLITTGGGSGNYVVNANDGDDKVQGGDSLDFVRTGGNFPNPAAPVSDNDLAFGGAKSDVLLGGYGSDQLWGDAADGWQAVGADSGGRGDWLGGEGGNDSLHGSRASDVAFGGAGEDQLEGGAGNDLLLGDGQYSPYSGATALSYVASLTDAYRWNAATAGMVKLTASSYSSDPVKVASSNAFSWTWSVAGGDYTLATPAGFTFDDRLAPDGGGDVLDGGLGDDWMAGQAGGDSLEGGDGNDILYGDDKDGVMAAADEGDDVLSGGAGADTLYGGGGDDSLAGGPGDDVVQGGAGQDTYYFNQGDGHDRVSDPDKDTNKLLFGPGIGPEDITLKLGSLALDLGGGDEIHIEGFDANDVFNSSSIGLFGFADGTALTLEDLLARGFDLAGTSAADQLTGTNTADRIQGLGGNDTLSGGAGNDSLDGGAGDDTLSGGAGVDKADYGTSGAGVRVNLGLVGAQKTYGAGGDTLSSIENLAGSRFNDQLTGGKGANVLAGGPGADQLSGKAGADRFVYAQAADSGATAKTRDTIGDFKAQEGDKIDLSALDADSAAAGRQAFGAAILAAFSATDATGQLVFNAASHILYGSTDADAAPEFSIALTGVNSLAASSLILA